MKYHSLILAIAFLPACTSFAQTGVISVTSSASGGQFGVSAGFGGPRFLPPAVTGAPYSGEETQEHTQTLSDGTHITQPMMRRKMYRDSLGRTRIERPLMPMPRAGAPEPPLVVEITDAAAGVQYTLDTQNKIAHRVLAPARSPGNPRELFAGAPGGSWAAGGAVSGGATASGVGHAPSVPPTATAPNAPRRQFSTEKLGPQDIDGILAEGQRITNTIPEGEQGNDRPIQVITETWTASDLKIVILNKTSDPRSGESIMRMTNLSRTEPDASLFQPPPDYTIVDETGPFTIHFGN